MKHWNTLSSVESQIIRVGEFRNLFELILNGIEGGSTIEQLHSGLYTMSSMLEDINDNLTSEFQILWDEIRDADTDVGTEDTFTVSALDPEYGDHGGGSTMAGYPELYPYSTNANVWQHTVNQISKFNK